MTYTCTNCGKTFNRNQSKYYKNIFCNRNCFNEFTKNKTANATCDACGKEFYRIPCLLKISKQHYCSRACSLTSKNSHLRNGENVICANCGVSFYKSRYNINHAKRHYCSDKCRNEGMFEKQRITLNCNYCNKEVQTTIGRINNTFNRKSRGKVFCNQQCFDEWNKLKYETKMCEFCGEEFTSNKNREQKFCSPECGAGHRKKDYIKFDCDYCGESHELPASQYNRTRHHYCSRDCRLNGMQYHRKNKASKVKIIFDNTGSEYFFDTQALAAKALNVHISTISTLKTSGGTSRHGFRVESTE